MPGNHTQHIHCGPKRMAEWYLCGEVQEARPALLREQLDRVVSTELFFNSSSRGVLASRSGRSDCLSEKHISLVQLLNCPAVPCSADDAVSVQSGVVQTHRSPCFPSTSSLGSPAAAIALGRLPWAPGPLFFDGEGLAVKEDRGQAESDHVIESHH